MDTKQLLEDVQSVLENNILSYWLTLKDPRGGFYGEVLSDGTILYDAPRGVILNARIIWSFAAAYAALHKTEYLVAAVHARDYFLDKFCDHKYGGVYWSVSSKGERLDTKKQLYAQGFAIYGLSELYKVTKDDEALKAAINLFHVVETKFRDTGNGGYKEALARDFSPLEDMSLSAHDINADKTMNSHLHILEAYANL
ncbi:MAG: AGE family epimerase/isomerase, partial [Bacteroidales bacterium]|nr:AGE family epimerase/isomerase [Bacteroidales bacterium]